MPTQERTKQQEGNAEREPDSLMPRQNEAGPVRNSESYGKPDPSRDQDQCHGSIRSLSRLRLGSCNQAEFGKVDKEKYGPE
jgi:hypothetical protein